MHDPVEILLNRLHHPLLAEVDLRLDRMHRLLSIVGNPQKRLPPVIHVAGTNGKGSLLAYIKAIFEAAGLRVHRYTSPHLIRFNERIELSGKPIDNAYLHNLLGHVAKTLEAQPTTFFEATTVLAFLAFADRPADVLLLETGVGGRLDATNVLDKPMLTAITPISFDHMEYLGNNLPAIASEKAGILKQGVPCIVGRQGQAALDVIERKAAELGALLYRMGKEWNHNKGHYRSGKRELDFTPSLVGDFQYDNAATAIACIDQLSQFTISDAHIKQGIASAHWPARLQHITQGVFAKAMPPGVELWLDGGHNPQGGEVLAAWLKEKAANKPVYMICAMLGGKDAKKFLAPLSPHVQKLYAIAIPGESKSQTAETLAAEAQAAGIASTSAPSLENALKTVLESATSPAIICICGSLYLAGKVLAANERT